MLGEKHLYIASLLCALLGISMLLVFNNAIEPRKVSIREISGKSVGERVVVEGRIDWVLQKENFILLTLNDGTKIKAIKFNPTQEERKIAKKNSYVSIVGKVQIYKNEIEVMAEAIRQ